MPYYAFSFCFDIEGVACKLGFVGDGSRGDAVGAACLIAGALGVNRAGNGGGVAINQHAGGGLCKITGLTADTIGDGRGAVAHGGFAHVRCAGDGFVATAFVAEIPVVGIDTA